MDVQTQVQEVDGDVAERLVRHPLTDPAARRTLVEGVQRALATDGCCVVADFVRPELVDELRDECAALAPRAHHAVDTVNVYNCEPDPALPPGHPARVTMERGNAFVARDLIPEDAIVARLYASPLLQGFLAECFGLAELHPLADSLAGLCLNVVEPGWEHPWHFDTNDLTVSLLTQRPRAGGAFEFCPAIRSPEDENLDAVAAVLVGDGTRVRRLELRPGDLQLFHGRYALHRVTTVAGPLARHSAIFAYSERPGVVGSPTRTRQLFGRLAPEHLDLPEVRVDGLLA